MENIVLVKPSIGFKDSIEVFRQEMLDSGEETFPGCGNLHKYNHLEDWLDYLKYIEDEETCPFDRVPASYYLAVRWEDNKVVGMVSVRHHIVHDILGTWGGHIGEYITPSERCKGYATIMLKGALEKCKELKIRRVLITCKEENLASEKVIKACGGVFESEICVEGQGIFKRYWITV